MGIEVVQGDITKLEVDAIVTSANESLLGGGGVDGAIHRAAGPALCEESSRLAPCPEGEARITGAYRLPARYVIHAVGPVYEGGGFGERDVLAKAYRSALQLAEAHGVESIAFPCISTGVYEYPEEEACEVAVDTIQEWLAAHPLPRRVICCCFTEEDAELYRRRLGPG